jgi:hypothetical protein
MMPISFEKYFQLYCESLSDIVWHYSNDPLKILKTDKISLGTETGPDATKNGKPFYLSTARSKVASYSKGPRGIIFKLDGNLLNSRYKARPIDYWGGTGVKDREKGEHEMEDRLYSDSPIIPNIKKYILEVQAWMNADPNNTYAAYIKKVEDECKRNNIKFTYYTSYENFIQNKDPKLSITEVIDTDKNENPEPYKFKYTYRKKSIRKILAFVTQLKDPHNDYSRYDSFLTLSNDYHSYLRREHDRMAIYAKKIIAKILKKLNLNNIDKLLKLRIEQRQKMLRFKDDIKHLDYKLNELINDMKDGKDRYYEIVNFNKQYQDSIGSLKNAMLNAYDRKDVDTIRTFFDKAKEKMEKDLAEIEKTLYKIPLKDPVPEKKDESWKDVQM